MRTTCTGTSTTCCTLLANCQVLGILQVPASIWRQRGYIQEAHPRCSGLQNLLVRPRLAAEQEGKGHPMVLLIHRHQREHRELLLVAAKCGIQLKAALRPRRLATASPPPAMNAMLKGSQLSGLNILGPQSINAGTACCGAHSLFRLTCCGSSISSPAPGKAGQCRITARLLCQAISCSSCCTRLLPISIPRCCKDLAVVVACLLQWILLYKAACLAAAALAAATCCWAGGQGCPQRASAHAHTAGRPHAALPSAAHSPAHSLQGAMSAGLPAS